MSFPDSLKHWEQAIWKFLNEERNDLVDKPTVGYFRFLGGRGVLTEDEADKRAGYAMRKEFCAPETYVRCRREGIEKGIVRINDTQRRLFKAEDDATRQHYGKDKRENPLWDH